VNISDAEETGAETLSYYQAECRKSAMAIVNFVSSLKSFHLAEFWLPCKFPQMPATNRK
jgi:hypothetical protein